MFDFIKDRMNTKIGLVILLCVALAMGLSSVSAAVTCSEACITLSEVQSETVKCIYIYQDSAYWVGDYPNRHQGHPCGIDITEIMEQTHLIDPALYLILNNCAPMCAECVPADETCNGLDDDCDGEVDEGCAAVNNGGSPAGGEPKEFLPFVLSLFETNWGLGRLTGILAYFFLALTTFLGVYRLTFVKIVGRKFTIGSHVAFTLLTLLFIAIHAITLLNDNLNWGSVLSVEKILFPSFGTVFSTNIAFGTIATCLVVLMGLQGLLLRRIVKKFGYPIWKWGHRICLVSFVIIFLHAQALGTDFGNVFLQGFFVAVFSLIVLKYVVNRFVRVRKISRIPKFETKPAVRFKKKDLDAIRPLKDLKHDPSLENKEVHIKIQLVKNKTANDLHWYTGFDESDFVHVYSAAPISDGAYNLKGILRFYGDRPYIEVTHIMAKDGNKLPAKVLVEKRI